MNTNYIGMLMQLFCTCRYEIHTGSVFSLEKGMIVAYSKKQKVNSRILTDSELIGVNDIISNVLWTRQFLECQEFKVKVNIIYQDNTSTMKMQKNCRASSGKRTQNYYIKSFILHIYSEGTKFK